MTASIRTATLLVPLFLSASGCITLKKDHDAVVARVEQLEQNQAAQAEALARNLKKADELAQMLESKLQEAEALLRRNQADLGLRVQEIELILEQLRGAVENAEYVASAGAQELAELRRELDGRLGALEQKLNEATNIPESKEGLWTEAERRMKQKRYPQARKLWRIYLSRYPGDAKIPQVRFQVGLSYFSERDFKAAIGEFYRVIQDHPEAAVLPDALYYSGLAFAKLGQCRNAIAYFEALQRPQAKASERYKKAAAKQVAILKKDKGQICTDRDDAGAGAAARQGVEASGTAGAGKKK